MKIRRLLLSKWFYYFLIALTLLLLFLFFLPAALSGHELAGNFITEIGGLFFTLVIFVMLIELREKLEWKSVENRVKRRIGYQIYNLFEYFCNVCDVNVMCDLAPAETFVERLVDKRLEALASEEIKLNEFAKKELWDAAFRHGFELTLDSVVKNLARIEDKYSRFLDSETQTSLMDIQDYSYRLSVELRLRSGEDEDFNDSVLYWIRKITKEIIILKRKGMWISWHKD